ncbi:patatin-like phospholipase family protein [Roseateles toxinivorans]|uniref:NTE family protein n=1 Tax=Roseateles toxinivorans TaxID=270368 RepID=A0A4R6QLU8_9BURK|nr:patatin-like phospholipase family protein [Roseateles toxinivorans]TDP71040.1 NTE family protein [Roseateles toxinivorans]
MHANRLLRIISVSILLLGTAAQAQDAVPQDKTRPRIGLVLSGGGARGLAHVGVLKVLERERIPVDLITGTSMGAIIGGLYASGMNAEQLERELIQLSWGDVFASRVDRQNLSQRRKEEDFEFSAVLEFGMRDGEFRAPQGTLSSRGLETLLRRFTLPVRKIRSFDALPTPFRAVSTDLETGEQQVIGEGDLALAMRSSMSVPGVFAPLEWEGRILGDGGLVNNLPLDIARGMGAQRLIAVNVGTPIGGRESLGSLLGVTAQMINILTEQNVKRSLATLSDGDVLIKPQLGKLSSSDFERGVDFVKLGEQAAEAALPQLRAYAVDEAGYQRWREARKGSQLDKPVLVEVRMEGSDIAQPQRFAEQLESKPGERFDLAKAERDTRFLASSGDFERVDYHVAQREVGDTLVFSMEDKSWGPNYFRVGLDLSTDLSGDSSFNLRISHNRHWLTPGGTEWRNQLTLGQTPRIYSELYHPLGVKLGTSRDWFVSGWGKVERRQLNLYDDAGNGRARFLRTGATLGVDLGQPWGKWGEVRLGVVHETWRLRPSLLTIDLPLDELKRDASETALRLKAVVDQLDFANFPQRGYRYTLEALYGRQVNKEHTSGSFARLELQATGVQSWGRHTLNLHLRGLVAREPEDSIQGPYSLGGFQQLSGYKQGQLIGPALLFGRASYYMRLKDTPVLTRGFFVGGSLEAGNTWENHRQMSLKGLRWASSLFLGTDTTVGPLYVGLGYAPKAGSAIYLFIGRP